MNVMPFLLRLKCSNRQLPAKNIHQEQKAYSSIHTGVLPLYAGQRWVTFIIDVYLAFMVLFENYVFITTSK